MSDTTPRHPVTGLAAVGWRKARPGETEDQPIWPILGGSEADDAEGGADATDDNADADAESGQDADPEGADQLGDAGKRALDTMKAQLKVEKERRKAAELKLASQDSKPGDGEPDAAAIRATAMAEARAETLRERALDRLEAKAARLFADPEDARALLASRVEDFVDGDSVDNEAIAEALTELLARKPHLAATAAKPKFAGTGDGGARKGPDSPKQLGKSDLKTMTAEQIVEAQNKGQFDDFLAAE